MGRWQVGANKTFKGFERIKYLRSYKWKNSNRGHKNYKNIYIYIKKRKKKGCESNVGNKWRAEFFLKKKKKKKRVELPAKASNFFIYFLGINRFLFSLSLFSFFQCKVIENQNPNIKPLQE